MERSKKESSILNRIEPVIQGLGFSLVEFSSARNRSNLSVNIVIYRESGVGTDDCSLVYKTVLPRIELTEDTRDVHLEVSSPGISRNLKSTDEFAVFMGRKVRLLVSGNTEWIHGRIHSVDDKCVNLDNGNAITSVGFADINKAKLE